MIFIDIICFLLFIFLLAGVLVSITENKPDLGVICIPSFILFVIFICLALNTPKAIEVYQGKTTLEYTIVDSVKIDSTVVYKPEYKK